MLAAEPSALSKETATGLPRLRVVAGARGEGKDARADADSGPGRMAR
jgi:hypothetical protein